MAQEKRHSDADLDVPELVVPVRPTSGATRAAPLASARSSLNLHVHLHTCALDGVYVE